MQLSGFSIPAYTSIFLLVIQSVVGIDIGAINREPLSPEANNLIGDDIPYLFNTVLRRPEAEWDRDSPGLFKISSKRCHPLDPMLSSFIPYFSSMTFFWVSHFLQQRSSRTKSQRPKSGPLERGSRPPAMAAVCSSR